jgi:hypothetical protein
MTVPPIRSGKRSHPGRRAGVQLRILAVAAALLASGAAVWYFHNSVGSASRTAAPAPGVLTLSESTRSVLAQLTSPVEVRLYSILDKSTVPSSVFAFVDRVNRLLLEFELAGNGKIILVRHTTLSDTAAASAAADGIKPFNLENGQACYLGLAVSCGSKHESLADFSPRWEPALEYDLSRAIDRVSRPDAPALKPNPETARAEAAAEQQVRSELPNLADLSLEDGTRLLREKAMKQYEAAVNEMKARVGEAQQRLTQAQSGGTEAEQAAALKQLQQVQLDQADKLKALAAQLDLQLAALAKLKAQ